MTAPDVSSEPRPKNEQGIMWVVSFKQRFKPSSVQSAGCCEMLLGVLLFLAYLCQLTLHDTEVCHEEGQRVPSMSWNQDLCCSDDNIN